MVDMDRQFYLERLKAETPMFVKVLKALPADKLSYKPHERSPSAEQIAWMIARETKNCVEVARDHQTAWKEAPAPPLAGIIKEFEEAAKELIDLAAKMDDASWKQPAEFYYQGKMVSNQPAAEFIWMCLFDAIHHRGQLSAYLRPMGGKVPAIYGPSADEKG
jgi:uncharacterized damage-inducible protein DinB